MRNVQSGFTLIELVVVIVILGILAVVALPKFIDLSADASQAAVEGVAGAISSASAINYGARKANSAKGDPVTTCGDAGTLLQGSLPAGYAMAAPATAIAADASVGCVVNGENSTTATATMIGIP